MNMCRSITLNHMCDQGKIASPNLSMPWLCVIQCLEKSKLRFYIILHIVAVASTTECINFIFFHSEAVNTLVLHSKIYILMPIAYITIMYIVIEFPLIET